MKRILYAPLCALILLLGALVGVTTMTPAAAADVCPDGDGWDKVDGLSGTSYTYTPPEGFTVTQNCYKASTTVRFGSGPTVTSTVKNKNGKVQDLSHASFLLVPESDGGDGGNGGNGDNGDNGDNGGNGGNGDNGDNGDNGGVGGVEEERGDDGEKGGDVGGVSEEGPGIGLPQTGA
ncbi:MULTISPECIES: hypothetical protein [Nocardioides]|uniref:Uncharacterized protein n=1 Tax=Nocardioides vastitatis TaxID=2568655 RepID=A0ABW0ZL82_9ACTN|nr:hypothetical protein [Nocardioides sp.]THJ04156.1 hypothetical protein E7Z54_09065 [Nocardioides sp.]